MLAKIGAILIISPGFSLPGAIVMLIGGWLGHVYMRAQLPAKREASKARSPVLAHCSSAMGGLGNWIRFGFVKVMS